MTLICRFCNMSYTRKDHLMRHLNENRCKVAKTLSLYDINEKLDELAILKSDITISGNENNINSNNTNIFNININIQPIQKLSLGHVSTDLMKELIEKYDDDLSQGSMNTLFSGYLSNVLCDKDHPENQAVKYLKKYPPTFNSVIEDREGNIINTIKDLNGTCELLSDPVLDLLKKKLREFTKKYHKDDQPDFDWELYDKSIKELRKELNKGNVKKVLNSFLKNDILNNIEMKLSLNKV